MSTVKEKIIKGIQNIDNEELLQEVYTLIQDIQETKQVITLNAEQKLLIEEARNDYKSGRYYSTEETFKDLLDD
ncbi:MAG: hypothetical protein IPO86_00320 [Saprospiraceae bacterium]|nr:hypothetical protein [Saprospiraceae bacterium]MBK8483016.1 hypothetical protein [Saprospiraceae bacterium]MBK8483025.1 hypothetical protein [Saprospiraceae bacterium]MBK9726541.1 hypothetical protein [Saprospiraceae bacterium]